MNTNSSDDGPRPGYAFGKHDKCQFCSFQPTSTNDYCDKHKPRENKMKNVNVKQDENDIVPVEVLATSIRAIAAGVKNLRNGPLGEKAILLLISENCYSKDRYGRIKKQKVSPSQVRIVLNGIESLQRSYLK